MPMIAATGAAWIRDDWNWNQGEPTKGNYVRYANKQIWLDAAYAAGLKVVIILNPNTSAGYANPYDPTAAANYCAWLAQVEGPKIAAIEVTNEPNNYYAGVEGVNWQTSLVTLTNTIYAAVKEVSPSTLILGFGGQGSQVLNMLSGGGTADGVVYHPYEGGDLVPEHVYEPPYTTYASWVAAVRAQTNYPIFETERNMSNNRVAGEYYGAVWNARRLLQTFGLGVEHTFIYDFADSSQQSVLDQYYNKRQAYYVLQRIMTVLNGLTTTGSGITLTPGASNFDLADFYSYVFAGPNSTVASVWLGNHSPGSHPAPGTGTVAFPVLNAVTSKSVIMDVVRGITLPLTVYNTTFTGNILSVFNCPITDTPMLIIAQ